MKKVLFTILGLGLLSLQAQVPAPANREVKKQVVSGETIKIKSNTATSKRDVAGPEWFTPAETIRNFNGGSQNDYSVVTLFPDTNALFTYTGTGGDVTYENIINSFGLVFDPRSDVYNGTPFKTNMWTNYTVDSLRFAFFYRRFNTDASLVDTIVVAAFDRTSITRGFNGIYAGAVNYSTGLYSASGTNVTIYKILLTIDDTAAGLQERVLAVNKTVAGSNNGGNYFGATISYLPGYKGYNHGLPFDTVANFVTGVRDASRVNTIRVLSYFDASKYIESTTIPPINGTRIYNHGIVAEPTQRYKIKVNNNVIDYYYPAFYSTYYMIPAIDFKVTALNLSVNSTSAAQISALYPNPASNGTVVMELNAANAFESVITIVDITGKVVKTMNFSMESGNNQIEFSTEGLDKGIYLVKVAGEGVNSVTKLVVE